MSKRITIYTGIIAVASLFLIGPLQSHAQELLQDRVTILKAQVVSIEAKESAHLPGLDLLSENQTITAKILEGDDAGREVTFNNDYVQLKSGDRFFLHVAVHTDDGTTHYFVSEPDRTPLLLFFAIMFGVLVLLVGGKPGLRGIISLGGSFALILYVLIPGILQGYSPVLIAIGVASLIIVLGSYVTHGFNKTTSSAVLGMIATVIVTGILAYIAVHAGRFTGYTGEESVYLNLNTRGHIDLIGVLLGGILIGLLGVLYDVAISQAISVEELHKIAPHVPKSVIFKRAMRIGREHIGALVNTLAIAYVGASLPHLLLFSFPPVDVVQTVNQEIFSAEIIRILIGSIGLVLAVPITTLISTAILFKQKNGVVSPETLASEKSALEHFEHHHG